MIGVLSEKLFSDYLEQIGMLYEKEYPVGKGNVDFKIYAKGYTVLSDVKVVLDPRSHNIAYGQIAPENQIRRDIRKLRQKFGKERPSVPVILVTMNFSSNCFTGLSIATALLGDIGVYFDPKRKIRSPLMHLPKGNASLTMDHNRTISAVFGFDRKHHRHYLFRNPFADQPIPSDLFSVERVIDLDKNATEDKLINYSFMFWPESFKSQI